MEKKLIAGLIGWVMVYAVAGIANGYFIDQSCNALTLPMAGNSEGPAFQSFVPSTSNIIGASVNLYNRASGSLDITLKLWDNLPAYGGTEIVEGSTSVVFSSLLWVDVFWDTTSITPGQTYFLQLISSGGGSNNVCFSGGFNSYPNGMVYAHGSQAYPSYDFAFKTYAVPEPATLFLLTLGGLVLRKRK